MNKPLSTAARHFFLSRRNSRLFSSIPTELTSSQQKLLVQLAKRTVSKTGDGRTHQKITKIQERSKVLKTLHDDLDVYAELFRESGLLDEGDTFGRALQGVPSPSAMGAKVGARVDAKVGADAKVDAQADAKADADVGAHAHADTHNDDDVRQLLRAVEDVGSLLLQDVVDFYKSVVNAEHHLDTDEVKLEVGPRAFHPSCMPPQICATANMCHRKYVPP